MHSCISGNWITVSSFLQIQYNTEDQGMHHLQYICTGNFSALAQLLRIISTYNANGVVKFKTSALWEQTPPIG